MKETMCGYSIGNHVKLGPKYPNWGTGVIRSLGYHPDGRYYAIIHFSEIPYTTTIDLEDIHLATEEILVMATDDDFKVSKDLILGVVIGSLATVVTYLTLAPGGRKTVQGLLTRFIPSMRKAGEQVLETLGVKDKPE